MRGAELKFFLKSFINNSIGLKTKNPIKLKDLIEILQTNWYRTADQLVDLIFNHFKLNEDISVVAQNRLKKRIKSDMIKRIKRA